MAKPQPPFNKAAMGDRIMEAAEEGEKAQKPPRKKRGKRAKKPKNPTTAFQGGGFRSY